MTSNSKAANSFFEFKWWYLFIIYSIIYSSIVWLTNTLIYTDSYYYSIWSNQLSFEKTELMIKKINNFQWVSYLILIIFLLVKWVFISGFLYTCLYWFNYTISFSICYKIIMIAEIPIILSGIFKFFYFYYNKPVSIDEVQLFYPLSVVQLLSIKKMPSYILYLLQQINIFEIGYWVILTSLIKFYCCKSFLWSFKISMYSYGIAMIIWLLFIVFLQIQFN